MKLQLLDTVICRMPQGAANLVKNEKYVVSVIDEKTRCVQVTTIEGLPILFWHHEDRFNLSKRVLLVGDDMKSKIKNAQGGMIQKGKNKPLADVIPFRMRPLNRIRILNKERAFQGKRQVLVETLLTRKRLWANVSMLKSFEVIKRLEDEDIRDQRN